MSSKKAVSAIPTHPEASVEEAKDWLTAEEFTHIEGMPGTARGARMRLEKLASLHPEIRRKRTAGKGVVYHISAATMSLDDERNRAKGEAFTLNDSDRQLSLWVQAVSQYVASFAGATDGAGPQAGKGRSDVSGAQCF